MFHTLKLPIRFFVATLCFFSAALLFFFGCSSRQVHLRFIHKEGSSLTYRVRASIQGQVSNDTVTIFSSSSSFLLVAECEKVYTNGDAVYRLSLDSVNYQTDESSFEEINALVSHLSGLSIKLKISPYGDFLEMEDKIKEYDYLPDEIHIAKILAKVLPVLPRSSLGPGFEWERQQQFPVENRMLRGTMYVEKHFKLASLQNYDNRYCAHIRGMLKTHIALKSSSEMDIKAKEGFLSKGEGEAVFDVENGIFIKGSAVLSGSLEAVFNSSLTDEKPEFPVTARQEIKIELLERP